MQDWQATLSILKKPVHFLMSGRFSEAESMGTADDADQYGSDPRKSIASASSAFLFFRASRKVP